MSYQPQQQTLSVRITQSLRERLERMRQLATDREGRRVSLSVVAKRLLESARDEPQEVVSLYARPTETLVLIRDKADAQQPLTRGEWTLLAYYAYQGIETLAEGLRPVAPASIVGVLDAFEAVHRLRIGESPWDALYLQNLAPATVVGSSFGVEDGLALNAEAVRRALPDARLRLTTSMSDGDVPYKVGRSLYKILSDESFWGGAPALHAALRPHWRRLWPLAARGHYAALDRPVRGEGLTTRRDAYPAIPRISHGGFSLTFCQPVDSELVLLVAFPGRLGPMYSIGPYPRLVEFRRMVTELGSTSQRYWKGRFFWSYFDAEGGTDNVWLCGPAGDVTVGCTLEQWAALREACEQAWELPAVREAWHSLSREYGEL